MNNKIFKIFLFFLVSNCLEAQNPAIKIYVADAENSKNISNAKVCLEGFEIPAIKAQYNKKEKYYYFTEIPKNYNTVMVYHKKYNEKGFQDINGLPKELKFKLHEPLQNYYDFDYETSAEQPNKKFYNYYVEDPYKIVIRPKKEMSYNDFRNYIYNYIKENNIEIEPVNPAWEEYLIGKNNFEEKKEPYPFLYMKYIMDEYYDDRDNGKVYLFPTFNGRVNFDLCFSKIMNRSVDNILFFFNKKNGEKFLRFNDPVLKKINMNPYIEIFVINYYKGGYNIYYNMKEGKSIKKYFKERDEKNRIINTKNNNILYKLFLYRRNIPMSLEELRKDKLNDDIINIPNCENLLLFKTKSTSEFKIPGIGIGIFDIEEFNYNKK